MKKRLCAIFSLVLTICLAFSLTSCNEGGCSHNFESACDTECSECGFTRTTTHVWNDATCFSSKVCRNCGLVGGAPLEHTLAEQDACSDTSVCTSCKWIVEIPLEHEFDTNGQCVKCGTYGLVTADFDE